MKLSTSVTFAASTTEFVELSEIERFDDGSGWRAQIRIGSGEFMCTGRPFYFSDLGQFGTGLKKIYQEVGGATELRDRYEKEFVRFEMSQRGHLTITGLLMDYGAMERRFQFGFEADQTFLPPFIKSIEAILEELRA